MIVPLILAAGASARMGRPKALLDFAGRAALDVIRDTCRAAGLARPVVVVGADAGAIREHLVGAAVRLVENAQWPSGQTSSLQCALRALPAAAEAFLVWPVDVPLAAETTVRALVGVRRRERGGGIVVPVSGGRRGHPALFAASFAAEFLALDPAVPAHAVVRKDPSRVREVPVNDPFATMPLDTPDDYARMREALRARRGRV